MSLNLDPLRILQACDLNLIKTKAEMAAIPELKRKAQARLIQDQATLASSKSDLQQAELAVKQVELKVKTWRDTLQKLEKQRYETKKNEEFAALGSEIKRYENEIDRLETEELELMEISDAAKTKLDKVQARCAENKALLEEELQSLDKRNLVLKELITELETKRSQLSSAILTDHLPIYERLLSKKKNAVVVPLSESGQCGACHMKVTASTLSSTNAQKVLTQCEHCACILFPG